MLHQADTNFEIEEKRKVQKEKLIVSSKGEETPIADNDTADGKAKNRRTELQIIK